MRLSVKTRGIFLGVSKTDYVSKSTGHPASFYNVAVKQGGEVGSIACTEDLFDQYSSGAIKDYVEADFSGTFDDRFNRLQITAVSPVK